MQVPAVVWGNGASCRIVVESQEWCFLHNFFSFFETEAVAVVTMLVSRYKIEIKEEPEFAGETFEERYARITAFDQGLTTT